MRLLACTLVISGAVHAEPRVAVLAIGGGWITGHSNDEHHGGAELAVERDLGDIYRVGAGAELMEYVIHDDECYGSTGQLAGAFATAGIREPTAETVHFFAVGRVGVRGAREVPSCYPASPVRYDAFPYLGLVVGIDVGTDSTRARFQVSVVHGWVGDSLTELAAGAGVSF